jgi:hypothetical protein
MDNKEISMKNLAHVILLFVIIQSASIANASEVLMVSSQSATPTWSSVLLPGVTYSLTVSGTYSHWSWSVGSGSCGDAFVTAEGLTGLDAGFVFAYPSLGGCPHDPYEMPPYANPWFQMDFGNGLQVQEPEDGVPTQVTGNHTYHYQVVGDGQPIGFLIWDDRYDDNYGGLIIEIEDPAISVEATSWGVIKARYHGGN